MECKKHGNILLKIPFHRFGFYCPRCDKNQHKTYLNQAKKRTLKRKLKTILNIINTGDQTKCIN